MAPCPCVCAPHPSSVCVTMHCLSLCRQWEESTHVAATASRHGM